MNESQLDRYSRQLLLANFDIEGQMRLAQSTILIVGLGGLGNIAATYLASAGVGELILADGDVLEDSNLPRQVLYSETHTGQFKVEAAYQQLREKNSDTELTIMAERLEGESLEYAIDRADVVLDCTDNYRARRSIHRACLAAKTPLISAAAIRWEGQLVSFLYHQNSAPCYECLYPDMSDEQLNCSQSGVIGPVVGALGVLQALDALKVASGCGNVEHGVLKLFDGFAGQWREMRLTQDPDCPACTVEKV